MLENSIEHADQVQDERQHRREANVISVLLPAREYRLECSWTTERPLPAVEEFACRLILVMDGISPAELKGYFGLSTIEVDGLIKNLVKNRLVDVADDGGLVPSAMLQSKGVTAGDVPTFTRFETKEEDAVFDLLALKIVPRRNYSHARFGLPEVPIPESGRAVSPDRIAEAFSEQSRAYLEYARGRSRDVHKTRLYKVSRCRPQRTLQVPIDMRVSLEAGANGELNIYRDAIERLGHNRRRALSNELESQVADYLAQESLPPAMPSVEEFCALVGDDVLARYARGNELDLGRWLADRSARRTGYGTPKTRALLGPIYLTGNRTTLFSLLKQVEREEESSNIAHWLPSIVPFWSANSSELVDFVPRFQRALDSEDGGRLVACFCGEESSRGWLKRKFHTRLPHAVLFSGNVALDRVELLVIPNRLVVAQYHLQPSPASAATFPIGFISVEDDRIEKVTEVLRDRLQPSIASSVVWSADSQDIHSLVDFSGLGLKDPGGQVDPVKESSGRGKAILRGGRIVWTGGSFS